MNKETVERVADVFERNLNIKRDFDMELLEHIKDEKERVTENPDAFMNKLVRITTFVLPLHPERACTSLLLHFLRPLLQPPPPFPSPRISCPTP